MTPVTRRSGSESPGSSPRRKGRGRRCNEDCDKTRSEQNQRVANLEKEKLNLKQQLNTMETHQKTLRSTISSKENLIQTQTQLVADHLKTISSQKQLIANLELTVSTHSDLAASFLDVIVSDDEGESDCEKNETHVFEKMHEKIKSLEERVRSDAIVVQNLEGAKEAVELSVSQLKEKLESKVKEYNGLKSHLSVVEETTLAREREIQDLKHDAVERQGTVDSITISNSNLRGRIAELEKLNERLAAEKVHGDACVSDEAVVQQLTSQICAKDQQISNMKENIEFSENAIKDAKHVLLLL